MYIQKNTDVDEILFFVVLLVILLCLSFSLIQFEF